MNINGFKSILERIKNNSIENLQLTHRDVRAYARCLLALVESGQMHYVQDFRNGDEIAILLACMASKWLNHRDRSFLASQMLEILNNSDKNSYVVGEDNIPF